MGRSGRSRREVLRHARVVVLKEKVKKSSTGLEPAISRFVGGCLIHWATRTLRGVPHHTNTTYFTTTNQQTNKPTNRQTNKPTKHHHKTTPQQRTTQHEQRATPPTQQQQKRPTHAQHNILPNEHNLLQHKKQQQQHHTTRVHIPHLSQSNWMEPATKTKHQEHNARTSNTNTHTQNKTNENENAPTQEMNTKSVHNAPRANNMHPSSHRIGG